MSVYVIGENLDASDLTGMFLAVFKGPAQTIAHGIILLPHLVSVSVANVCKKCAPVAGIMCNISLLCRCSFMHCCFFVPKDGVR